MENTNNAELKKILGGTYAELAEDSEVLHRLGLMDEVYGESDAVFEWSEFTAKVTEAYRSVGVICLSGFARRNKYFYRGEEISRQEAQQIAEYAVMNGKVLRTVGA